MPRFILLLFLSLSSGSPAHRVLLVESTDAAAARAVLEPLSIAVEAVDRIDDAALGARLADYDGVIIRSSNRIGPSMIAAAASAGRLRVIGRAGVGVDNIDLDAARESGVAVVNAPGANSAAVAEHTIALALAVSRRVAAAHASVRAGRWERGAFQGALLREDARRRRRRPHRPRGRAARRGARHARDERVRARRRARRRAGGGARARARRRAARGGRAHAAVPLADETANLVDAAALARMRPGACVINAARGGVVDERALLDALEAGALGGAALDVYANEGAPLDPVVLALARLPNVVCTPHIGAATAETAREVSREVAEVVACVIRGGVPEDGLVVAPRR